MQNSECIEMFEKYLTEDKKASANTLSSYLRDIRQLADYLDKHTDHGIHDAEAEDLAEYIAMLRSEGKSVATVSRSIASIKCLYSHLFIKQLITVNPAQGLIPDKNTQKLPEILTSKEVELLLEQPECVDAKGYRDRAMLELLYATGIRVSELQFITVEAVKHGFAKVNCKGKSRTVFIVKTLQKKLLKYVNRHHINSGSVFITKTGKPINRTNIWREMKQLCRDANVNPSKVFPHNLRHLFARTFYGIEKDIAKLADILGHSSINTTRIYIVSTGEEHRQRLENMRLVI